MEQNKAGRLSPVERVKLARSSLRPGTEDYIKNIIEDS